MLTIASPCPLKWESLQGTGNIRYCGQCRLNVYNLAEMDPAAVDALVRKAQGRLCGRLYVRDDGRSMLRECGKLRAGRLWRRAVMVGAGLLSAVGALLLATGRHPTGRQVPPEVIQGLENLGVIEAVPTGPKFLMGDVCVTPPPPPKAVKN